jgi:hypothetical protein
MLLLITLDLSSRSLLYFGLELWILTYFANHPIHTTVCCSCQDYILNMKWNVNRVANSWLMFSARTTKKFGDTPFFLKVCNSIIDFWYVKSTPKKFCPFCQISQNFGRRFFRPHSIFCGTFVFSGWNFGRLATLNVKCSEMTVSGTIGWVEFWISFTCIIPANNNCDPPPPQRMKNIFIQILKGIHWPDRCTIVRRSWLFGSALNRGKQSNSCCGAMCTKASRCKKIYVGRPASLLC